VPKPEVERDEYAKEQEEEEQEHFHSCEEEISPEESEAPNFNPSPATCGDVNVG